MDLRAMGIPGAPNTNGSAEDPPPTSNLLPPWATDTAFNNAVLSLVSEADSANREFNYNAERLGKEAVREAEAFLIHIAEGW